jgi:hypothetical protein
MDSVLETGVLYVILFSVVHHFSAYANGELVYAQQIATILIFARHDLKIYSGASADDS